MKEIRGMWFPDTEKHMLEQLAINPIVDKRGTYQYRKYAAALKYVDRCDHAVDIGGHVGLWSRVMALDFGRVTAFEPLPEHILCFQRNLIGAGNVTLHQYALDARPGRLIMNMPPTWTGNTHVAVDGEEGIPVESRTLDSFALTDIDFLKIDVEGYELPILQGGEETIRREKPVMVIEQKPGDHTTRYGRGTHDALDLLKQWGGQVRWEVGGDFLVEWE